MFSPHEIGHSRRQSELPEGEAMEHMPMRAAVIGFAMLVSVATGCSAIAETKTVRIAKQFGISYLPITVMESEKLLEKHAKAAGLDVTTQWIQFTGGTPMNDAIISGSLDFASGGVGPMITIWGKTRGALGVKGVASLNSMPLYLVSMNPKVKSIADLTDADKIALPAAKTSIQALTLQMAAERTFGPGQQYRLDPLTVSMGHPDAQTAMMGERSGITAHFGSAPFMYQELADPRGHKVLDSYEVMGGPHTFNVVWATTKFHDDNPKLMRAFIDALSEAQKMLKDDPARAAAIYVKVDNSKMDVKEVERMIHLPENEWTIVPKNIMGYADFMHRVGALSVKPASWKDLFFSELAELPGS
jgi:NitT/TauT family transport system substrate-binding protein